MSKFYSSTSLGSFAVLFALLLGACDVVPSADDAPQVDEERRQFQTPRGVVTTPGDSQILIQWAPYLDAQNYTLYWSNQSSLTKSNANAIPITGNSLLHAPLTNGTAYYYAVSAMTNDGETYLSPVVSVTPNFATLPAPQVSPVVVGDERNTLNWSLVPGATSYSMYWSNDTSGDITLDDQRIDFIEAPFVHQNLSNGTQYHYRITANNHNKTGEPSIIVAATPFKPAPTAPTDITLDYTTGNLSIGFVDISDAAYFNLYWKTTPDVTRADQRIEHIQAPFVHTPLDANTVYYYRLSAVNSGSNSALSAEFSVDTDTGLVTLPTQGSLPALPADISVSLGNQQITLNWNNNNNDPDALGYNIYWNTGSEEVSLNDNKIANVQPPYTLIDLLNGVNVNYVVTAINDNGESSATTSATAIPQIVIPGVPTNVTAAAADTKIALSWASVSDANDYTVYWGVRDVPVETFTDSLSNVSPPVLIENLQNGTDYTFVVSANNAGGESEKSIPVSATPQIPAPRAPSQLIASPANTQVQLSWTHDNTDSQQVSAFRLYWSGTKGGTPQSANVIEVGLTQTFVHNQLVNGRAYYYVMTAVNAGGESIPSAEVQVMPQVDIPGAPTQVAATPGDGQVTIDWQGESTPQNYNLYWWTEDLNNDARIKRVIANVASGHTVTGLQNSITYHFYVAALNAAGESVFSNEVIATPQVPPPTQASANFNAVGHDGAIQLSWDTVPEASTYKLYWSTTADIDPNKSAFFTDPVLPQSGFQHTGLVNGNTYYYAISGMNPGGEGPLSAIASATPQVPAPAVPPTDFSVTARDAAVTINWDTTRVGVDAYRVYWSNTATAAPSDWILIPGFRAGESHKQLTNGVVYYYRITALNAGGESPASAPLSATPQIAPPAIPTGLTASVIDDTQIALNWFQKTGLSYNLYWATTANVPLLGVDVNKISDIQAIYKQSNLTSGTPYYYVLTAQNPGGESAPSPVVSVTSTIISPDTPTNLSAVAGDATVTVQWQAIADPLASYALYWTTDPTTGVQLGSQLNAANKIADVSSPYVHSALTNGTEYYYVVTASVSSESAASTVATVTPNASPNTPPQFVEVSPQPVTLSEDSAPTVFALTLNAIDTQNDTLTWSIATQAVKGVASVSGTGPTKPISYTPNANFNGTDTFVVQVSDATAASMMVVNVTIEPVNDTPTVTLPLTNQTAMVSSPFNYAFPTDTFADIDGDTLTYAAAPLPAGISFTPATRTFTGTPTSAGSTSVIVTATDPGNATATSTFTLTVDANGLPVFGQPPPTVVMSEDGAPIAFSLSMSASDPDGNALTWRVVVPGPANGSANVITPATGNSVAINYVPSANVNGTDSFSVQVDDGAGGVVTQLVNVTIEPVNDAPTSGAPIVDQTASIGISFDLQFPIDTFNDIDGDALTLSASPLPVGIIFTPDTNTFSGTPTTADSALVVVTATDPSGATATSVFRIVVDVAASWSIVEVGGRHTAAVKTDGSLWSWGRNKEAQLGDGTNINKSAPTKIGASTTWANLFAGEGYNLALKVDGALWAWGSHREGQLGIGSRVNIYISIPTQVSMDTTWTNIAAGSSHTLAIKEDGTLWAWGWNSSGQLGDGIRISKNIPVQIGTDNTWSQVNAGSTHSFALKNNGTLWAWGTNENGQLGSGKSISSTTPLQIGMDNTWSEVDASTFHNLGLKTDGTLWAWGVNFNGQLGDGTTSEKNTPVKIGVGTTWASIKTGYNYSLAIKTDGTLWAWGLNSSGQLGDGTNVDKNIPVQIGTNTNWKSMAAGTEHSLAIKTDNTLWAWGRNDDGQLGDGSTINKNTPVLIE